MRVRSLTAGALHLFIHAAAFAVAAYALAQIVRGGTVVNFIAWFAGAAVLHDLVLLPLYSLLDRLPRVRRRPRSGARAAPTNYVRAPALISGVLLLVYFPPILGLSERNYYAATGHHLHGYARNWLLISAALFAGSGLLYAVRALRTKR
jgi:hypothetical protein